MSEPGAVDIVIIDYGMGNLRNVQKAFEHMGIEARISSSPSDLDRAAGWVLPGVGAFGAAMRQLSSLRLVEPLRRRIGDGKPTLAICLGMQLLFEESEEHGSNTGLGLLQGRVQRIL